MPQMKRILKKQIVFIFFVLIIALTCILAGKKIFSMFQTSEKNRPYDFHVPEGTTDIEAYQIPEEELEQLSTESLAETILSNAFLMQFEAYDSSKTALEMHKDLFNVYPALFSRKDCEDVLLDLYENARIVKSNKNIKPEEFFRVHNIEILLAARMADNELQGTVTDQETEERLRRIHKEKNRQRNAADISQVAEDGFLWFEEYYY